MSGHMKKDDLRIVKTRKALQYALVMLLERSEFNRLTVHDICEEAQVSRPTFYAHYRDKYDLLDDWLGRLQEKLSMEIERDKSYSNLERVINSFVRDNTRVITNLLSGANAETKSLIHGFIVSLLGIDMRCEDGEPVRRHIVFSNFCIGGVLQLLDWQIENRFPADLQMVNRHMFKLVKSLIGIEYHNKAEE